MIAKEIYRERGIELGDHYVDYPFYIPYGNGKRTIAMLTFDRVTDEYSEDTITITDIDINQHVWLQFDFGQETIEKALRVDFPALVWIDWKIEVE